MKSIICLVICLLSVQGMVAQVLEGPGVPIPLEASFGKAGGGYSSTEGKTLQVLVGFDLVKATVIEGITPLLASLEKGGTLGRVEKGPVFGRKVQDNTRVEKPGYHVAGVVIYEGLWYGQESVKQIKVLWKKWGSQETAESVVYGIGQEKNDKGRTFTVKVPDGRLAVGIHGLSFPAFLNRVSLVTVKTPGKPIDPPRPPVMDNQVQGPSVPQGPSITPPTGTVPPPRPEKPDAGNPDPAPNQAPVSFKGLPKGTEYITPENEAFETEVLRLVNIERQKAGLKPVALDTDLARAARYHAADMTFDKYFDHNSMDRQGNSTTKVGGAFDRIGKFSSKGHGENIAQGQQTPEAVMKSWMNSSGHKANILAPRSTLLGVGYIKGTWVQVFGS